MTFGLIQDGEKQFDVSVEDLSARGAKLRLNGERPDAASFDICFDGVGEFPVHVCWRYEKTVGIQFDDVPEQVDRRFGDYLESTLMERLCQSLKVVR